MSNHAERARGEDLGVMKATASLVRLLALTWGVAFFVGIGANPAFAEPTASGGTTGGSASSGATTSGSSSATAASASTKAETPQAAPPLAQATSATEAQAATTSTAPSPAEPTGADPTASPASSSPAAEMDGATYRVRLRDLEQRVDELKEKIRQSHTRLSLLSDTVLSGAAGGARAEVVLENDLSGAWRLIEAVVVLDGAVQFKKTDDTGVLAAQKKIPIFTGSIPSGDHVLQVMLKLRGHGFGVFSYLRGIEATVRNDYAFTLNDGKLIELRAVAWEQGGPTTPVEEQPAIRFVENIRAIGDAPRAPSAVPLTTPTATESKGTVTSPSAAPSGQVGASTGGSAPVKATVPSAE